MSFNGSGTFQINTAGQPVTSGTLIESAKFNSLTADLASGLSNVICKDGQTTITANIPLGGNKLTGVGNAIATTDALTTASISAATSKATPVDADELAIADSASSGVLKKLTWANLKATLQSVTWNNATAATTATTATAANGLKSATTTVSVSAATAPTSGQVLTATSDSAATWQSPSTTSFSSSAENIAGTVENKAIDPLGIREAFNCTGTAPVYACRAWVNFDGTGTIGTNMTIRGSGNVSSVYKNATGDYTINFTTSLPDENYAVSGTARGIGSIGSANGCMSIEIAASTSPTNSALRIWSKGPASGGAADVHTVTVVIMR